jgi:hypothetical protein
MRCSCGINLPRPFRPARALPALRLISSRSNQDMDSTLRSTNSRQQTAAQKHDRDNIAVCRLNTVPENTRQRLRAVSSRRVHKGGFAGSGNQPKAAPWQKCGWSRCSYLVSYLTASDRNPSELSWRVSLRSKDAITVVVRLPDDDRCRHTWWLRCQAEAEIAISA